MHRTDLRVGHSYFRGTRRNDSFPASAIARYANDPDLDAVEWQWTIADVVMAVLAVGLRLQHLGEHPEPFWARSGARALVGRQAPEHVLARRRSPGLSCALRTSLRTSLHTTSALR